MLNWYVFPDREIRAEFFVIPNPVCQILVKRTSRKDENTSCNNPSDQSKHNFVKRTMTGRYIACLPLDNEIASRCFPKGINFSWSF